MNRPAAHPLTLPQREIWLDQQLHPGDPLYNMGGYLRLQGPLDLALFRRTIQLLADRHDALRTVIVQDEGDEDGLPRQAWPALAVHVPLHDFSGADEPEQAAQAWMQERFAQPFALQGEPLFRCALLRLGPDLHLCFNCYHHLVADGWTTALLARAAGRLYSALLQGGEADPGAAAPSYLGLVEDERRYLGSAAPAVQREYWRAKFQPLPEPLLPPAAPLPQGGAPSGCSTVAWPRAAHDRLAAFAREQGATTFHAILAAVAVYFTRTAARDELVLGLPSLNRGQAVFKATAGLFAGMTLARLRPDHGLGFAALMRAIGRELRQDRRHHRFPLSQVHEALGLAAQGRTRLFDVGVSYQREDHQTRFGPVRAESHRLHNGHQPYPLMLHVCEFDGGRDVQVDIVYHRAHLSAVEVEALQQRLFLLLEAAQRAPDLPVRDLPLLTPPEAGRLQSWQAGRRADVPMQALHHAVQRQARATPEAVALVFEGRQLGYHAMNAAANRLAHRLIAAGVTPDALVAVCAERSIVLVVALLAVLKAGGAYVPLDPDLPAARLAHMLDDSRARWVLVQAAAWRRVGLPDAPGLQMIDLDLDGGERFPDSDPALPVHAQQLACLIYTSGSTGRPKGAGVPHAGLANRLGWMQDSFALHAEDRVLQKTPFGFDVSVWEFFWPLMTGAALVLARPGDHQDPARLAELIQCERITTLHFVPSMLQAFVEHGALPRCSSLRRVMASGEALPAELVRRFRQQSRAALHNLYGPTEASIDVTAWACTDDPGDVVPIGRPIANTVVRLLDAGMQPVPVGAPGELYIGGVPLARGYHGRPDLTAERFVPDPFGEAGARLYRSGDLARWRADGAIEYLGRSDHQVKIRGQRIELGEIEAVLSAHPAVREAVVMAHDGGDGSGQRLVAYLVSAEPGLPTDALREHLRRRLPEAMVPAAFVRLAAMPLTPNGKLDRRALPAPQAPLRQAGQVAPRTATERWLARLWCELLGVPEVGVHDDFFKLGGHSLLAARLVARLRRERGIELPLRAVFDAPVLEALASRVGPGEAPIGPNEEPNEEPNEGPNGTLNEEPGPPKLARVARGRALQLSFPQQRLWFLDRLEPGSAFYNMAGALSLRGPLDAQALQRALDALVQRHEVLRTVYVAAGDAVAQHVAAHAAVPVEHIDLGASPAPERDGEARRIVAAAAARPFDLQRGPVLRAHLLVMGEHEHRLLLVLHHIAADGWSLAVLQRELAQLYWAGVSGTAPRLPALPLQYADFAAWQRQLQGQPAWDQALRYWRAQLADAPPLLALPTDHARPAVASHRGDRVHFELPAALAAQLHALGRQHGATLFMTLLGAFGVLLSRCSGQHDLCIGTPVANRRHAELEGLVGCFVNTLVMRLRLDEGISFSKLLPQLRETALGAYAHQDLPFEELVDALQVERSLSHSPLFQAMFLLQDEAGGAVALDGLQVEPLPLDLPVAKFDLTLELHHNTGDSTAGLRGCFEYRTELFERTTIERLAGHFQTLLAALATAPEQPVAMLPMLTPAEQRWLVDDLNASRHDFPLHRTYGELFSEQAARHPDRIAAVFMGERLSYRELDERSNRIARALVEAGAGPGTLVGVLGERGLCHLAMVIGILKAGAAYVPLDLRLPAQRLRDIVTQSGMPLLLASDNGLRLLDRICDDLPHGPHGLPRALRAEALWLQRDASGVPPRGTPDDLAYVIFTSGSTGVPKGAMVTQRGMLNNLYGKVPAAGLNEHDRVAQTASPAFDISVWQCLAAPLLGGTVHVLPDEVAHDPRRLMEAAAAQGITVMQFVPSVLRLVLEESPPGPPSSLRCALVAGEALPPAIAAAWFVRYPEVPLVNIYGPAECADNVAFHVLHGAAQAAACTGLVSVPIGGPTANNRLFILDAQLQPVPVGVVGEICVAGVGVGRGYLGDPDQTARAFVEHPLAAPGRLYRTGDLGRRRPDGTIDFLGRRDQQLKLRGQRVELGEVEARLRACAGVRDAAVIVRDDLGADAHIVAYWTGDADAAALRGALAQALPAYMLPAHFVALEQLPLNANGKTDRQALAALPWVADTDRSAEAPATDTERQLAQLWSTLLERPTIGRDDDFFHLGGHSLLATRLVSRIREAFSIELPLRSIFEAPTLRALATCIEQARPEAGNEPDLLPADRTAPLPLSFAQQRLWFIDQLQPAQALYNMPGGWRLAGALDVAALHGALNDLVARHEVLRTAVDLAAGSPVQRIAPAVAVPLPVDDLSQWPAAERDAQAQRLAQAEARRPFDLRQAPMLRARLLRLAAGEHWLLLTLHHIAGDGWSAGIVQRELAAFYRARCTASVAALPPLPVQYADFAAWQRRWLDGVRHDRQMAYWRGQLEGAPALLDLPADHARPLQPLHRGDHLSFEIDAALVDDLRALGRAAQATLFMTLAAAFALLLGRLSRQDEVCLGTPVANRRRPELEGLVGFFVNTLVLRLRIDGELPFPAWLQHARETVLAAQAHQDLPFERLVEALQPERQLGCAPLFQVMFGFDEASLPAPALHGLHTEPLPVQGMASAKFDLMLHLAAQPGGSLSGSFQYSAELFERATIQRWAGHFRTLLAAIVGQPGTAIADLPLLSPAEQRQLLLEWSGRPAPLPGPGTIHERFESHARTHGGDVALVFEGQGLTYAQLDARSNRLAHRLRAQGVQPDDVVGLCAERSVALVLGMLATLKAGAAYLPLDPALPAERLGFMLADARPRLLLVQPPLQPRLPATALPCIRLDGEVLAFDGVPDHEPASGAEGRHLAYVIYTSGSTGRPKGVGVAHQSVVNLVCGSDYVQLDGSDRVAQVASSAFDAATFEVWGALLQGAQLHLWSRDLALAPAAFARELAGQGITTLFLTTALFNLMARHVPHAFRGLRHVLFGGEAADPVAVAAVQRAGPPGRLLNVYGPTENTTFSTWSLLDGADTGAATLPIGRPIARTAAYILDRRMKPVPIGVVGELHLGGEGLARGYLGRPDLTAECFVQDPFSGRPGARMYRTGDLARHRPDGRIEHVGRTDHQVKIRGHRVELGEIESALVQLPEVHEAAVLARPGPEGLRLVAYVAAAAGARPAAATLRAALQRRLPEVMVPAQVVLLDRLPLNVSGKIDRRALEAIDRTAGGDGAHATPATPTEQRLAAIWAGLLGHDRIGRDDGFFQLGGHSLLAVRLVAGIEQAFGLALPLSQLFLTPSLAALAAVVDARAATAPGRLVVPLAAGEPGQVPLWLIHPGGGTVLCYRRLAALLPPRRPVHAIQSAEAAGLDELPPDFESLCRRYVDEILAVQPRGPFHLAGWSLGGAIALRCAELLEQWGHGVAAVGLLDTMRSMGPDSEPDRFEDFVAWALLHFEGGDHGGRGDLAAPWQSRAREFIVHHGAEHFARQLADEPRFLASAFGAEPGHVKFLQRQHQVLQAHAALAAGFRPGRVRAPLHVFQAQASVPHGASDGTGWFAHTEAPQRSTAHLLPGRHETLLQLHLNLACIAAVLGGG